MVAWAAPQIAQCNRTATEASNFIVQGYGDDTYQPTWVVTRGQMAVFIARAAGYTDDPPVDGEGNPDPSFQDVPDSYWAYTEIEQCVANGVVQGYADYFGTGIDAYLPGASVDRGQMAVYIQRAAGIATAAYTAGFDDVDDTFWAATEIQGCVDEEVVYGYDDNLYRPWQLVNRAQMAVFVWRGLVRGPATSPLGSDVVLGGPGALDPTAHAFMDPGGDGATAAYTPGTTDYDGWTEGDLEPGAVVYLVLDGVRVGAGNVDFRVYHIVDDAEVDDDTASQAVTNQRANAAAAGGNCYYAVTYQVPSTITDADDYTVEISLPDGAVFTLGFTVE